MNNDQKRQRDQVTPATSTDSIAEPKAQRPAIVDLRTITERFPLLPIQTNMGEDLEWLREFLRLKPKVQRAERESFDFYY